MLITYEAASLKEYKHHEGLNAVNWQFMLVGIAFCLECKTIVFTFWACKLYYITTVIYTFCHTEFTFLFCHLMELILFPIIILVLAKIMLSLFEMNCKISDLLCTIKNLLKVLPESILIESFDEKSRESILKFMNNTAQKDIIKKDFVGLPVSSLDDEIKI